MAINEIGNCSIKGIVNILAPTTELNSEIIDFDAVSFQNRTGINIDTDPVNGNFSDLSIKMKYFDELKNKYISRTEKTKAQASTGTI